MILIGVKAGNITCMWYKSLLLRKVVPLNHGLWEMKGVMLWEAIFQSTCFQFRNILLSAIWSQWSEEHEGVRADEMLTKSG